MGNGGGIIKRKLLFAVLLVFGLSMTGIAASSAAPIGHAKTQSVDTYTVEKNINVHSKNTNNNISQVKTQTKKGKHVKLFKNKFTAKNTTTPNKNIIAKKIKANNTKITKKVTSTKNAKYNYYKYGKWYKYKISGSKTVELSTKTVKAVKSAKLVKNSSINEKAAAGSKKKVKSVKSANTSSISSLAASLTKGVRSDYQKGSKIFNWVRDNINYSFYYNTRYGASGTLKYRKGNCADTAHLVVALARSAGLKARYVHGKARFKSGHVYGHVWAQIWANGKWYTADATSSRNSFGVVRSWSSATIKGTYNKLPF